MKGIKNGHYEILTPLPTLYSNHSQLSWNKAAGVRISLILKEQKSRNKKSSS